MIVYEMVNKSFSELMEININIKTGKTKTIQHTLDQVQFIEALKKGNKLFKMLKGFHYNPETKQGFFSIGKKLYQFRLKQLANILTLSLEDSQSYYIEIN